MSRRTFVYAARQRSPANGTSTRECDRDLAGQRFAGSRRRSVCPLLRPVGGDSEHAGAPRLPSDDSLRDALTDLADFVEEKLDPPVDSVFEAANYDGEQSISFEQVGSLTASLHELEIMGGRDSHQGEERPGVRPA